MEPRFTLLLSRYKTSEGVCGHCSCCQEQDAAGEDGGRHWWHHQWVDLWQSNLGWAVWVECLGEFGLVHNLLEGTGSLGMWSSQIPAHASCPQQIQEVGNTL